MTSLNQASMTEAAANAEESGPIDPFKTNPAKEEVLHALCDRTGYQLTQENGQRKYGGPPPGWIDPIPGKGCEIFVGKLPRDLFEDELVPVLETCGKIYELRLMMDFNGNNRGFAFVKYCVQADAKKALKELNNFEIRKGRLLGVCKSVDNCRLFVGGIPKNKQKTEILTEMKKLSEGVIDVIVYPSAGDKTKNRGFAFVEYQDHHTAAMARRKLMHNRPQLWGHQIAVDWAEPEVEVDDDIMAQVKILYVRNLMLNTTDDALEKVFQSVVGNQGAIERVKKIRDYAFIHFNTRENALKCMRALNGHILDGAPMQVTLAKPVDRETYVRYTRAANRQNVVEAEEQLTQAAFPYVAPTAIDPASLAAYQTAYQGTIYYNGIPYATTSAAIPGMPVTQRIPAGNLAYQGRQAVQIGSVPQIGAAGVPLGIPGASSGIPLAAAAARGITARGRVRGAGGTRPIQTTRGYLGRGYGMTYYRRPVWHPPPHQVVSESVEQGVKYDLMPEMELIPINPQSIKLTNQQKSSVQILEDLCKKNQWEMPDYKLHSAVGQNGLQLFLYRVSIPGLSNNPQPQQPDQLSRSPSSSPSQALQQLSSPKQFTPTKLSTSLDVAKEIAAEYVIQNISHDQISTDGDGGVSPVSSDISPTTVYLTNGIAVTNGNHGIRSYATEANVPPSFNNFVFQNGGYSENITATTVNGHMYHQY